MERIFSRWAGKGWGDVPTGQRPPHPAALPRPPARPCQESRTPPRTHCVSCCMLARVPARAHPSNTSPASSASAPLLAANRYTWPIYARRLVTLSHIYTFWKHVTSLESRETKRYLGEARLRCCGAPSPQQQQQPGLPIEWEGQRLVPPRPRGALPCIP